MKVVRSSKLYFDWAAEKLGIQKQEDWYSVPSVALTKLRGRGNNIHCYNDSTVIDVLDRHSSLAKALEDTYPQFDWHPWRFDRVTKLYWSDKGIFYSI